MSTRETNSEQRESKAWSTCKVYKLLIWLTSLMCILQFASVGIAETFLKDSK